MTDVPPIAYDADTVFAHKRDPAPFSFNLEVVNVFPDMIRRSAPGYTTIVEQLGNLAPLYAQAHSIVYDLGSSLGAVSMVLRRTINVPHCRVVALDSSKPMVEKSREYFNAQSMMHATLLPVTVIEADITQFDYEPASVIALNLTLQFIAPQKRLAVLQDLHQALLPGGALFLTEKIQFADPLEHQRLNELHIGYKRAQGYSELEVAQKRQALENVMLIDTFAVHKARLLEAGFSEVYQWFQCLNFISIIALK